MHGKGLVNPVWGKEGDRVIAGTLPNGALIIRTLQPDGTSVIDCIMPAKREAA